MPIQKILVVDDSPTERLALSEVLVKNGFQVVTAESGDEAVVKSKSERPDLILMDVVMPGTNGYQATRTIVRDEATRDIPVIICTSKGLETDKIWGMRQGAFDYMVKPLDHAVLLEKIRALELGHRRHGEADQPPRIPGRARTAARRSAQDNRASALSRRSGRQAQLARRPHRSRRNPRRPCPWPRFPLHRVIGSADLPAFAATCSALSTFAAFHDDLPIAPVGHARLLLVGVKP
jgi:twitching motility two-component system response regulator PilH